MKKENLAIVGTGIAAMSCAHFLHNDFNITMYDSANYLGGHTNTVDVDEDGKKIPIDTGFIVYNEVTYPNLKRLFKELNVETKNSDMSFSVQYLPESLEYCGSGLNGLFAQRKNIFSYKFIKFLLEINRFNTSSINILEDPKYSNQTVKDFIKENNYNSDFLNLYLIPMSSAVWSTPKDKILDFPILSLVRFFYNHGFLGLNTQHQWKTVVNGSRQYAEKITAPVKDKIYLNHKAISVSQNEKGVSIQFENGKKIEFDRVILACHGDTALEILENPTAKQKDYLSHFKYEKNIAVLHTDDSIMPKTKLSWSSWNYRIEKDQTQTPCTIYWMNRLQGVSDKKNYFVSINNPEIINPSKIIKTIHYEHPLFSAGTYLTQPKLPELNENSRVYFTGSYFRYGFHEDALTSSVNLCEKILGRKVWN